MSEQIGHLSRDQALAQLAPWPHAAAPIGATEFQQRIERARALVHERGVDALLVTAGPSLRYFTGVPWPATERLVAMLLTGKGDPLFICPVFEEGSLDAVLAIPAKKALWDEDEDPHALIAQAMAGCGARTLALDPGAAFAAHSGLRAYLDGNRIVDAAGIIDGCRMYKSDAELALMQQACDMTMQVHRLAAGIVSEGVGSDELVHFIDQAHRALGADRGSTFCIVQFGHATAYPHGVPGVQHLREDELVLIDTGCTVQGYNSDITRTYVYGEPGDAERRTWDLEKSAQAAAFAAARPGVACEEVDAAARRVVEAAGMGPGYRLPGLPHRTGHGCGLAVHEAPYLVRGDRTGLQPGICVSNEPMIVVPGQFGIRLEDHFHITGDGARWFTQPSPAIDRPFA